MISINLLPSHYAAHFRRAGLGVCLLSDELWITNKKRKTEKRKKSRYIPVNKQKNSLTALLVFLWRNIVNIV